MRVTEYLDFGAVLLRELEADQVSVRAADVRVPTLDDVFLSLTGRSLREDVEVAA